MTETQSILPNMEEAVDFLEMEIKRTEKYLDEAVAAAGINSCGAGYSLGQLDAYRDLLRFVKGELDE